MTPARVSLSGIVRILAPAVCLAFASAAMASDVPPAGTLVDTECDIPIADVAIAARLRCARLHVLRDPTDPGAGRFEIAVVVKRSAQPKPGATPVLFLHGGPGGAITPYLGRSANDFLPGHDFVAFDMRGSGRSTPRVCDAEGQELARSLMQQEDEASGTTHRQAILARCRDAWHAAGFAPGHFGTDRNVADAEALREALGVSRWLLFSESYGTTVAAHYVATVPDRIEAAVLDSLYPADADVLPVTEMQGRLVDRIADDCRADAACAARFPAFGRQQLDETVTALDAAPLAIGHRGAQWRLDGMGLRRLVMAAASFEAGARSAPLLVDAALRRDVHMLAGPVRLFDAGATAGGNLGALFATDCRDRARHHANTLQDDPMRLLAGVPGSVCRDWTTPGEAPRWPIGTAVPMLVLSGGYDSFQPDAAAIVARLGGAVRHVDVPVAVHGARGAGACVRDVIAAFLTAPTAPPDTTCIAAMKAPAFVTAVTPVRGPVLLMAPMASGGLPDPMALLAAALAILALLVALWASWKRRPGNRLRWTWLGTLAAFAPVCGGLAFLATTDAMANAEWIYGLPVNWSWVAWLAPAGFVLGAVAATRDAGASTRITGPLACIGAVAWALAGWPRSDEWRTPTHSSV